MARGAHARARSTLLGMVVVAALAFPVAAHAAPAPLSLTLEATTGTVFTDDLVTMTATASPAVPNVSIVFTISNAGNPWFTRPASTDESGVATATFRGTTYSLPDVVFTMQAMHTADDSYDGATSNTVDVTLDKHPATMTVSFGTYSADGGPVNTVDSIPLHGRLHAVACDGQIEFEEFKDDYWASAGSGNAHLIPNGDGSDSCGMDVTLGQRPLGDHVFRAAYGGSLVNDYIDWQDPFTITVTLITTTTALATSANPVEVGSPIWLTATIGAAKGIGYVECDGLFTFYDGATVLGTKAPTPCYGTASISVSFADVGVHDLHATWGGSPVALSSTSPTLALTVSANVVHATGLGVSASTFYPVTDGYADTVGIRGTLGEPASIAVTIRSTSTNGIVRRLAVPSRNEGVYTVAWNGRS